MTIEFDGINNKLGTTTANSVTIKTNDTDAITVDNSQNVGIGTSSPSSTLSVKTSAGTFNVEPLGAGAVQLASPTSLGFNIGSGYNYEFDVNGTEAMRIDSSGNVGIGTTTTSGIRLNSITSSSGVLAGQFENSHTTGSYGIVVKAGSGSGNYTADFRDKDNTTLMRIRGDGDVMIGTTSTNSNEKVRINAPNDTRAIAFQSASSNECGYIYINGNGLGVTYSTSSDYRLKENVVDIPNATERLKQLQPKRFNFIGDENTTVDGFLAHEVQSVVPEAINGEKDAMKTEEYEVTPAELDEEGNVITEAVMGTREVPVYQGIDQSKLVPLLVASLKEALTEIDNLKARIEALENL